MQSKTRSKPPATSSSPGRGAASELVKVTIPYQGADRRRSLWQMANTIIPYLFLWYLMYRSLSISYWLTLALAIPAAALMMRTFIIFHDCGHGSFFKSARGNTIAGYITGILTFTPYEHWRHEHNVHHATAGDLDRRGVGDIWTLTVAEYRALTPWQKLQYRIFRNPLIMLGLGPLAMFGIRHRFCSPGADRRSRNSVWLTNLALLAIIVGAAFTIGLRAYLLVQLPILMLGGAAGIWMFYVQHQFENVRWERHAAWDFVTVAVEGSSYYKLPAVLNWISGNIGYHHIHHLNARIPNYNLARCFHASPVLQPPTFLTLRSSLHSLGLRLYDEDHRRMVGYRATQ